MPRNTFVSLAAPMGIAGLLLLSACSTGDSGDTAASRPTPSTVTVTATQDTRTQGRDNQDSDNQDDSGTQNDGAQDNDRQDNDGQDNEGVQPVAPTSHTDCSTDGSAAITDAANRIAPPLSYKTDVPWVFGGNTNYNTCRTLSYASLDTQGATASSPMQLLLFHNGRFLGTGIKCNAAYQTVTKTTDTAVYVNYRYLNDGDVSANPTGSVDVWFEWTGSGVTMHGTLPYLVTYGKC